MPTSMTVRDIMSSPVVAVLPSTRVVEVAALMRDRRVGGVPVMDGAILQGIITKSDLMQRCEIGTDVARERGPWWRTGRQDAAARAYVKSHGRTARHVMSRRVRTLAPDWDLGRVAHAFEEHGIGRAPVVSNSRVIGIVARADLVRALAEHPGMTHPAAADDEWIRETLVDELARQPWWNGGWQHVYVVAGVVLFKGFVEDEASRTAARVAAENIPGVRGVVDDRILRAAVRETL